MILRTLLIVNPIALCTSVANGAKSRTFNGTKSHFISGSILNDFRTGRWQGSQYSGGICSSSSRGSSHQCRQLERARHAFCGAPGANDSRHIHDGLMRLSGNSFAAQQPTWHCVQRHLHAAGQMQGCHSAWQSPTMWKKALSYLVLPDQISHRFQLTPTRHKLPTECFLR